MLNTAGLHRPPTRPLSFLFFSTFYPPYCFGGDGEYLYRLSYALAEEGHQVDVVHCTDAYHFLNGALPLKKDYPEHPNLRRHELESGWGAMSPLLTHQTGYPLLKRATIQALLDGKPDVIHYHNLSLLGPGTLLLEPPGQGWVKLYTIHDYWLVCPTHALWKFKREFCEEAHCLSCTLHSKRPPQLWRYGTLLQRASQQIDQFVTPSLFAARMHQERGYQQPMAHLPHFCDLLEPTRDAPRPEIPYFLFVGRLEDGKGVHELLRIWERTERHELLLVGEGSLEHQFRALSEHNPRIRFLGWKSQAELSVLYRHAVATLVPSRVHETFGLIAIESLAQKTPVIARNRGGLAENLEASQGGIIYESEEGAFQAIQSLIDSPDMRRELGERGHQYYLAHWTKQAHLASYFALIHGAARMRYGQLPWNT